MLNTIMMGSCIFVQGLFVKNLPDGRVQVRVGSQTYVGKPVGQAA